MAASAFKALADPTRRRVLDLLKDGPMTAGELADQFEITKPAMSNHFKILREAGLIDSVRQGQTISYVLTLSVFDDAVLAAVEGIFDRKLGRMIKPKKGVGNATEIPSADKSAHLVEVEVSALEDQTSRLKKDALFLGRELAELASDISNLAQDAPYLGEEIESLGDDLSALNQIMEAAAAESSRIRDRLAKLEVITKTKKKSA